MAEPTLVNTDPMASGFMQDPAMRSRFGFDAEGDRWLDLARDAARPDPPGKIGPYELLEEVGRGGQGAVYKARQPGTNRLVAIKRLSAGALATAQARARFQREVELVSSLDHPGIVTVFGAERVDDQHLLVMEFVSGRSIDRWSDSGDAGRRPPREVIPVFLQVCDAVAFAHRRGVIHRDLKPGNILVDDGSRARVLDFGLARALDDSPAASARSTGFQGTPAYASPEQIAGQRQLIDTRSDVFALGGILYRLLTGVEPFDPSAAIADLFDAIRSRDPARPSQLRDGLNDEVDAIVLKALRKQPQERYQSADALAADLRRYLAGETVLAHPPSLTYQVKTLVRRHKTAALVAAVGLAGVGAFGVVSAALAWNLDRQRDALAIAKERETSLREEAVAARADAEREALAAKAALGQATLEAQRHERASDFLKDIIQAAGEVSPAGSSVSVREMVDQAALRVDQGELANQPAVEASVLLTIAQSYSKLGYPDLYEVYVEAALDRTLTTHGPRSVEYARVLLHMGLVAEQYGRMHEALAWYQQSLDLADSLLGEADPLTVTALNNVGTSLHFLGRWSESEAVHCRVLAIRLRELGENHPKIATTLKNLGSLYRRVGRLQEAEDVLTRAVAIMHDQPQPDPAATLGIEFHMARLRMAQQRYPEAEVMTREQLQLAVALYGADHPGLTRYTEHLAQALEAQNKFAQAVPIRRASLSLLAERRGPDDPGALHAAHALGRTLRLARAPGESRDVLTDARARAASTPGVEGEVLRSGVNYELAHTFLALDLPREAERFLTEDALWRVERNGLAAGGTIARLQEAGRLAQRNGNHPGATDLLRRAAQGLEQRRGAAHAQTIDAKIELARTLARAGDLADADRTLLEALGAVPGDSDQGRRITEAIAQVHLEADR